MNTHVQAKHLEILFKCNDCDNKLNTVGSLTMYMVKMHCKENLMVDILKTENKLASKIAKQKLKIYYTPQN